MIFMMKIWRHKVLELLHAAVEPASRPGCRRSGLNASFESNAHATTASICGDSQTSSLLRGRLDRQGHALGLTRFHVVKMHFKILKIVCDRARYSTLFPQISLSAHYVRAVRIRGSKHREHTTHMCRPHRVRASTRAPTTRTAPHTQRCSQHDHLQLSRSSHQHGYSLGLARTWELELSFYVLPTECARL